MMDATTNCGFGGVCDDFYAFLAVGIRWRKPAVAQGP